MHKVRKGDYCMVDTNSTKTESFAEKECKVIARTCSQQVLNLTTAAVKPPDMWGRWALLATDRLSR